MKILKNFFALPAMNNEVDRQTAQVLRGVLFFFSVISLSYAVLSSLADIQNWGRYFTQGGVLLAAMFLGMFFLRRGYTRPVAIFVTLVIWLVITVAAYTGGGVRSSGYFGYLVVLVVAGVLSGKRLDTLLVTLLCLGAGYYMVYAETSGILPPARVPVTALALWLDSLFYFAAVAGLLFLTMRMAYTALQRLNYELVERQRTEGALRESEAFRQRVFESSRMPIVIMESENLTYIDCNPAAVQIYGFATREKTLGKTPLDVSAPFQSDGTPSDEKVRFYIRQAQVEGGVVFEWRHQRPNQEVWDAEVHLMSFFSGERQYLQFTLQDITQRKQAERQVFQTANQLTVLNEIGRAVSEVTDLATVLEIIRQELEKLVGFDFYSVRVFNAESQMVTHLAVYENGRYWQEPDTLLFPNTDTYKVFQTGQPVLHLYTPEEVDAYLANPYMQIGDRSNITMSTIFVPLKKQGQTIGALSVQRREPNAYAEEHLRLVEAVAIQVAIAIENARLFTTLQSELTERKQAEELTRKVNLELQRRIKELYALHAAAQAGASAKNEYELLEPVIETLYQSLYPDIVGVALWNENEGLLRTFPRAHRGMPDSVDQMVFRLGEGIVGHVAATRLPHRMRDIDDPFYLSIDPAIRSELCVPILAGEKLLGVLDIESRQPDAFSDADQNLLLTVAGQIATTLERLRAEQQLRALNADLEQRVSERTAQLEAANKELESFSYSVSHDLRAPLRSVNGFAKILANDFSQEFTPPAREFLDKIVNAGSQMAQLIDELLDFSRLGRKPLNLQPVDVNEMVQSVIESLAPETGSRQIEWVLAEMPLATADPALLRLVYVNLVGNAVKYTGTRQAARIEVGCLENPGEVVYFVRDNGVGFDMQYADNLFGVFQRLHRDDEFEGTGIGLATVKRIIERHNGRIWAEAKVDMGAAFYFTFGREQDSNG